MYFQTLFFQYIFILLKTLKTYQRRKRKKQYGRKRYKNLPKDEKQRLVEHRKKIKLVRK